MGRSNRNTQAKRPQVSKRTRYAAGPGELDLMVRFTASRDRDRDGMGR